MNFGSKLDALPERIAGSATQSLLEEAAAEN